MSTHLNIIGGLRIIILLACFIMACVGTARTQFRYEDIQYRFDGIHTDGWKLKYKDIGCKSFETRMRSAYALSVMTCIFLIIAVIVTVVFVVSLFVDVLKGATTILRISTIVLSAVSFIFCICAWSLSASALHGSFCDQRSLSRQGYEISEGLGLLIGCWILLFVDLAVCVAGFVYALRQGKD